MMLKGLLRFGEINFLMSLLSQYILACCPPGQIADCEF
jgi:hypothetical protein